MSMLFFNNVLSQIGRKLNYESISNLYGNSFCKDASKYIESAYTLTKPNKIGHGFADMLSKTTVVKAAKKEDAVQAISKDMGDVSWAEGLF